MAVGSAALEQGRDLHDRPRYMTQQALQPSQMPSQPVSSTELSFIASSAGQQGAMAAAASGALSGALVYALTAFSPRFRALTPSASIKTALVVSPMFAAFFYKSHLVIGKATRDPRAFLSAAPAAPQRVVQQHLAPWQAAANIVYEHPFKTIFGVAGPLYGAIFFKESTHPSTANMILSQRLIHTRVYGQASLARSS
ncbi:hypothetical protein AB1Y20_021616 [Prymnesium parvum]|uniref:Uncharacterized protein n=1 Tax=Prymnesium parvum TaxID=97485 RepID=A0AB34JIS3_PRYPA